MSIILGKTSMSRLLGVDDRLVRVVKRAAFNARPEQDFMVLEGVRSKEKMWANWGQGRTVAQCQAKGVPTKYAKPHLPKVTWLNDPLMSNHRATVTGGRAVDLLPWPFKSPEDWADKARFFTLYLLMMEAAEEEKVHIRWGKDWDEDGKYEEKGESDGPHFELVT